MAEKSPKCIARTVRPVGPTVILGLCEPLAPKAHNTKPPRGGSSRSSSRGLFIFSSPGFEPELANAGIEPVYLRRDGPARPAAKLLAFRTTTRKVRRSNALLFGSCPVQSIASLANIFFNIISGERCLSEALYKGSNSVLTALAIFRRGSCATREGEGEDK